MSYDLNPLQHYFRNYTPAQLAKYIRDLAGKKSVQEMGESYYALNWLAQELDFLEEKRKDSDAS